MLSLRPYQAAAIDRLRALRRAGARRFVLVAPTGAGKTLCASTMIATCHDKGQRALVIAHRRILVEQMREAIAQGLPDDRIGVLMGKDKRTREGAPVQVSCIDTLARRPLPEAQLVVVDEAHLGMTPAHRKVLAHYAAAGATIVGLTATPVDGMGDLYDELVVTASVRELTEQGYLCRAQAFSVPEEAKPDLRQVPLDPRTGDFEAGPLAKAVGARSVTGSLIAHWRKYAGGRPTLAFAVDIAGAEKIAERFNGAGIGAGVLHSKMSTAQREVTLLSFRHGAIKLLASVDCLSEGSNLPMAKCALVVRPTELVSKWLQIIGRVLRPFEDQTAVIIDPVGNLDRPGLGLPTDDRDWTLTGLRKAERIAPLSSCPACLAVFEPAKVCPACGFERVPAPGRRMRLVAGELVEVTESRTQRQAPTREQWRSTFWRQSFTYPAGRRMNKTQRAAHVEKKLRAKFPEGASNG